MQLDCVCLVSLILPLWSATFSCNCQRKW